MGDVGGMEIADDCQITFQVKVMGVNPFIERAIRDVATLVNEKAITVKRFIQDLGAFASSPVKSYSP
jgi:hypothetical protein